MTREILFYVLFIFTTFLTTFSQTIIPGGNVSGTWTALGSPYNVQGNITIQAGSALNIEQGVEVNFQGDYSFTVNGLLQAIGTAIDSIHFTAVTTWMGLRFINAPDSSHLAYCTISGSTTWGGLLCTNSNPVITHSTISNNGGTAWGGIYLSNSNSRISYCTISNNLNLGDGGGIYMASSSPQISYCSITGNYGINRGGGIYIAAGNPSIDNCTISDNHAGSGGGIAFLSGGQVTITDCIITADTASGLGGGIFVSSPGGSIIINNSTISNCVAPSGGAVYIHQAADVSIIGSTIESNIVQGGGGVVYISQAGTVSMMRTTLDDNFCGSYPGGVIYSVDCSNLNIDHCDVVNNRAAVAEGGIILDGNTSMIVKNCIFRNQDGPHIWFQNYTSASVSFNDFFESYLIPFAGGPSGLGVLTTVNAMGDSCDVYSNILLDPLFVDFAGGDYHLTVNSPCIDAGDPASTYDPDGTITDMGRYFFDQGGTGIPGGYVSGTWTAVGSPYRILGDIIIQDDSTLTIEPGVVVNFQGNYSFTVNGFLQAIGTLTDSIHFTASTDWGGINFANAPDSSHLIYCTISECNTLHSAVHCNNSNVVITHCTIENNWALIYGAILLDNSNSRITHCSIKDNRSAMNGGGINILNSTPVISYCDIIGNGTANNNGGGIYCALSTAYFSHCNIIGNRANFGGGIYFDTGGHLVISNSLISYNTAYQGAGITFLNGSYGTISNCTINADSTTNDAMAKGAGILISSSSGVFTISNSTISNCWSRYGGSGIHIDNAAKVMITGSIFDSNICYNNTNVDVGAIYSADCDSLIIDHCDLVKNYSSWFAGGITLNGNTNLTLTNSIFRSQYIGDITFANYSSVSVSHNDFYGSSGPFVQPPPGLGTLVQTNVNGDSCDIFYNIYLDPQFVDFSGGDYHLTGTSPCIDAGDPASPYDPDGTVTDMGKYFFDQGGTGIPGGYVSGTWTTAGSPYRILGDISIHADSVLTIEPGVEVIFQGHYKFIIDGIISAAGTEQDSILFTAADTSAGWWGLRFTNAPDGSQLSYCILQYGRATGGLFRDKRGGAIYAASSRPQITHCTITNNIAQNWGGAIYVDGVPAGLFPQISHCIINKNTATYGYGGGVYFAAGSFDISDCIISENTAGGWGGGLYIPCAATDTVIISNCIVSDDSSAGYGGGIYVEDGYTFIIGCTISNNKAGLTGGGLYEGGNLSLTGSVIQGNVSWGGLQQYETGGGGIIAFKNTDIRSCVIADNMSHAGNYLSHGGGGLFRNSNTSVHITNSKIRNNTADLSGGLIINANDATLAYCEISDNQSSLGTGGAQVQSWSSLVDHCTFFGNVGGGIGGLSVFNDVRISNNIFSWNSPVAVNTGSSGSKTIEYSDFYGNAQDLSGTIPPGFGMLDSTNVNGDSCDAYYNIFLDPLFADTAVGDYRLSWASWPVADSTKSPCIDAGDPSFPYDPDNTITDMGRYYFDQVATENLILNPGCEDALVNGEIPYWTEVIGSNWTQRTAGPDPYEGLAYFFPGVASLAELDQDVDVSTYKSEIDNGNQSFIFVGYVRAWPQNPPDQSRVILEFLDSLKTTKIDSFDSGNYSNTSEWVQIIDTSLAPPGTRHIRIRLISTRNAGTNNDGYYDGLSLVPANITGIKKDKHNLPENPILFQNYPNPFNPVTHLSFDMPRVSKVKLVVYDILGRKVSTLVNKQLPPGHYELTWDAGNLPSGLYFYRLETNEYIETRKMILMK